MYQHLRFCYCQATIHNCEPIPPFLPNNERKSFSHAPSQQQTVLNVEAMEVSPISSLEWITITKHSLFKQQCILRLIRRQLDLPQSPSNIQAHFVCANQLIKLHFSDYSLKSCVILSAEIVTWVIFQSQSGIRIREKKLDWMNYSYSMRIYIFSSLLTNQPLALSLFLFLYRSLLSNLNEYMKALSSKLPTSQMSQYSRKKAHWIVNP